MRNKSWTVYLLYMEGRRLLAEAGVPDASFDALALLGITRKELLMCGADKVSDVIVNTYENRIELRKNRYPLQYILGTWDFYGMEFSVGEGVLIPRPETELLVETVTVGLQTVQSPTILDLCSGSGVIGITLSRLLPNAEVVCTELSDNALYYLNKNVEQLCDSRVRVQKADVLEPREVKSVGKNFDVIVSNPPYLSDKDMRSLQPELTFEPAIALSGGKDGLVFYNAIADYWLPILNRGGILCVEFGMGQAKRVAEIFAYDLSAYRIINDINGIERILYGIKR